MTVVGKTISHYKILEKLGGGGMGIVYKAQDLKLDRFVALKFLPPYLSTNEEEKQRFIQEAKAASALDHSNICTIFEIGETKEGQLFIAMAYYEGETLKAKISKRPLPLKEVVDIATQIAAGLSKAHEAGIIHRDIKPANVIVTKEGEVKIVDFGLAKLTGQTKLTKPGSTLGTISYMSPEQLRGEKTDSRSDIWSLGVVMYEMITGQLPFKGDYEQAITYSILNDEPEPITALRTGVPMTVEGIIIKALVKDPKHRYQHIDELPVDLEAFDYTNNISRKTSIYTTKIKTLSNKNRNYFIIFVLLAMIIGFFFGISYWKWRNPDDVTKLATFRFVTDKANSAFWYKPRLAISPDGKNLVYVGGTTNKPILFLRPLDQMSSRPIAGTEGATTPFFSPDGQWIGFLSGSRTLRKVALSGGAPVTLHKDSVTIRGACWGENDRIIFCSGSKLQTLSQISSEKQTKPKVLFLHEDQEAFLLEYRDPEILPNQNAVIFTIRNRISNKSDIGVFSFRSNEFKLLIENGFYGRYIYSGHIVYAVEGESLFAVPFDQQTLDIKGPSVPILENEKIPIATRGMHAEVAISKEGNLAYISYASPKLVIVDRKGHELKNITNEDTWNPRFSPDNSKVALTLLSKENRNIWIYDIETGGRFRLTYDHDTNRISAWSPDGKKIAFTSRVISDEDMFWKSADGRGNEKLILKADYNQFPHCWTTNSQFLIFSSNTPQTGRDLYLIDTSNEQEPRSLIKTESNECAASLSPDGKWLAYVSDKTGVYEVYIQPYPSLNKIYPISRGGGTEPLWSPMGNELFYRSDNKFMSIEIETRPNLKLGSPEFLFEADCWSWPYIHEYDVTRDGNRFLIRKNAEMGNQIIIITNWFNELERKFKVNN
jgi:serine/threonine protein kinase